MQTEKLSSGRRYWSLPLLLAAAFTDPLPADAADGQFGPNDFRITHVGPDGDTNRDATSPAVVWNSVAGEYFVAWQGDHSADFDLEIFAQRIATDGSLIGAPIQVSFMGPPGTTQEYGASNPDVAFNPDANEYLVVWHGYDAAGDFDVFGHRVDASGNLLGAQFRISSHGPTLEVSNAEVVYNAISNEYLVGWSAERIDGEMEAFGQRLDAGGNEVGANDFRISDIGVDGNLAADGFLGALAWSSVANEYLVGLAGDDLTDEVFEGHVQRLDSAGSEIGGNDIVITNAGPVGDARVDSIAHNPLANEYLVAWGGIKLGSGLADAWIQRLDANAGEIGTNDLQITNIPPISNGVLGVSTAFISGANEYLAVVQSDREMYTQRLDAAGSQVGPDDFLISDGSQGNAALGGSSGLACRDTTGECLIVWGSAVLPGPGPPETEIYGQLFGVPVPEAVPQANSIARASLALLLAATGAALLWARRRVT